jgi:hypothetical protein
MNWEQLLSLRRFGDKINDLEKNRTKPVLVLRSIMIELYFHQNLEVYKIRPR